jgi:hypothetical protein
MLSCGWLFSACSPLVEGFREMSGRLVLWFQLEQAPQPYATPLPSDAAIVWRIRVDTGLCTNASMEAWETHRLGLTGHSADLDGLYALRRGGCGGLWVGRARAHPVATPRSLC